MAIDSTTFNNHKFIKPAVGMAANAGDIEQVLGESSGDLGTLCQSKNINRWAKYKPVVWSGTYNNVPYGVNTYEQWDATNGKWYLPSGSDAASVAIRSKGAWWRGSNAQCGLTLTSFASVYAMVNDWMTKGVATAWDKYWAYVPPTGTSSQPFRQTDFSLYIHKNDWGEDNDKPWDWWNIADTIRYIVMNDGTGNPVVMFDSGQAQCHMRQNNYVYKNENLLLTLDDISTAWGAAGATQPVANYYFGVAIARKDGSNLYLSAITTHYTWGHSVTSAESQASGNPAGTDYRYTPDFPKYMIIQPPTTGAIVKYYAFPFISETELYDNSVEGASNPTYMRVRTSDSTTRITARVIPLPFAAKEINVVYAQSRIEVEITGGSTSRSGTTLTVNVNIKATREGSGLTIAANDIKVMFQVYPNREVPTTDWSTYISNPSNWTDNVATFTVSHSFSNTGSKADVTVWLQNTSTYMSVNGFYQVSNV